MKKLNIKDLSRDELILLLTKLIGDTPNDYDLGKKIRSIIKNTNGV
jgi:hypothetical protein